MILRTLRVIGAIGLLGVLTASPAFALDPNLAEITEPEALRSTVIVQKTMLEQAIRNEALQRAYVLKLERAITDLEVKLQLTEKALKATPAPKPPEPETKECTPEPRT